MPLPQKSFFFVRHGESESNQQELMCGGGIDTPLTDRGRRQAKITRDIFQALSIQRPSVIYHSDLCRASETASILNEALDLAMIETDQLREHYMGDWEGKPWSEVVPKLENKEDPINGETFKALRLRVKNTLRSILEEHTLPLIVAHGGIWHAIAALYQHKTIAWPSNADLYFFKAVDNEGSLPWNIYTYQMSAKSNLEEVKQNHMMVVL